MNSIRLARSVIPYALFAALTAFVFRTLLFPPTDQMLDGFDVTHFYYFMRQYLVDTIRSGEFPWWNPHLFSGMPYAESPQITSVLYLPNWLFFVAPPTTAFSWYVALHITIAMSAMYWGVRKVFADDGVSRLAAWLSGVVYGLSGFFVARTYAGHIDMIASASYLPFVFAAFWRAMDFGGLRFILLAAVAFTVQYMSGYQTVTLFTMEAVLCAALIKSAMFRSWSPVRNTVIAVVLGVLISAVQLVPNAYYLRQSTRSLQTDYGWSASYTAPFQTIAQELVFPPDRNTATFDYHERASYIGIAGLAMALIGFVLLIGDTRKRLIAVIMGLIGIFGMWASLAKHAGLNLFAVLWVVVPMYRQLRIPPRHMLLYVFAVSLLSYAGFAFVLRKPRFGRLVTFLGIAFVIIAELWLYAGGLLRTGPIPSASYDATLIKLLKGEGFHSRVFPMFHISDQPSFFHLNAPVFYGVHSATGTESSIVTRYYRFMWAISGRVIRELDPYYDQQVPLTNMHSPYVNFLNIKYVIVPVSDDPLKRDPSRYALRYENSKDSFRVYENIDVLPRYRLMYEAALFESDEDVLEAVRSGNHDPVTTLLAVRNSLPVLSPCETSSREGSVRITSYTANEVTLSVSTPCDAYLSGSDVNYPGWRATVDGRTVPVQYGNYAFRAIVVPKGTHHIVFFYDPVMVRIGASISTATVLTILLWVLKVWYSRRHVEFRPKKIPAHHDFRHVRKRRKHDAAASGRTS